MRDCRLGVCYATCLLLASIASAAPGHEPAATLLLPYFEVDLADPANGMTTLFSVNNAGTEAVVAHVVTWTDWGIPTYSFDLALGRDEVQTVNLRDLFILGRVPATDGEGIASCGSAVGAPPLEAAALEALRSRHSGRPDLTDGLCYGSGRLGSGVATGYVTVDVVRICSGKERFFPGDFGYFPDFAIGTPNPYVEFDNVLWGDSFYVAAGDDSAQGVELVHIPFDEDAAPAETFYRLYSTDGSDRRALLGSSYRARFLAGGAFDGGTELLVWLENSVRSQPVECGERDSAIDGCYHVNYSLYTEGGTPVGLASHRATEVAFRRKVDNHELPGVVPFGFVQLDYYDDAPCGVILADPPQPRQSWLLTVMRAEGRYSVGLSGVRVPLFGLSE